MKYLNFIDFYSSQQKQNFYLVLHLQLGLNRVLNWTAKSSSGLRTDCFTSHFDTVLSSKCSMKSIKALFGLLRFIQVKELVRLFSESNDLPLKLVLNSQHTMFCWSSFRCLWMKSFDLQKFINLGLGLSIKLDFQMFVCLKTDTFT